MNTYHISTSRPLFFATGGWGYSDNCIFFLKFDLACRKILASQGFWYQGLGALLLPISPKFSDRPSPELRASMENNYIFGILVEKAINYAEFRLI